MRPRLPAVSIYWVPHKLATFYHHLGKQTVSCGSMHIAILGKFPMAVVIKSMIVALTRSYYTTPINMSATILWARFIAPKLPLNRNAVNRLLVGWLRDCAQWSSLGYASCHILHTEPHTALCGDWNTDIVALHVQVEPQGRSGWGSGTVHVCTPPP